MFTITESTIQNAIRSFERAGRKVMVKSATAAMRRFLLGKGQFDDHGAAVDCCKCYIWEHGYWG